MPYAFTKLLLIAFSPQLSNRRLQPTTNVRRVKGVSSLRCKLPVSAERIYVTYNLSCLPKMFVF